jgi:septal ring factor EnvC (AmiA/AmiB activator)
MTQAANNERLDRIESQLENVVTSLGHLTTNVEKLTTDVEKLTTDVEGLKQEVTRTNDRVEIYQKASQQVVNLAFGLIVAATAAIIVPAVFSR